MCRERRESSSHGWVGWLSTQWDGVKGVGSKDARSGEPARLTPTAGENNFNAVRHGGATTTGPDATPPQLSVKTCGGGGGGGGGGVLPGVGGGGSAGWGGVFLPGVGGGSGRHIV